MSQDIKIEIGKRIREERERQGLTREQVCDTEDELTVKQLMRIELGRSLPTIVKLQYISDKLNVSLNYLLGETNLDIPEDYYQDYDYDKERIEKFRHKLIKQELQGDELFNVELIGSLSAVAGIYVMHHDYKEMKSVVNKMYEVMHFIMQHSYQPGIAMLEAKYYLYYENDINKATELYNTATVLAEAFGDQVFIKNLKMEMKKDLNTK